MGQDTNSETESVPFELEYHKVIGRTDEKKHKCTFHNCGKAFDRPSKLARHFILHSREKCYKCNQLGCNKIHTNSETESVSLELENHKVTGCTDEKKHKCTFHGCNKAFDRPFKLARHVRLHTKEKSYQGNHPGCNKACTNSETEFVSLELESRKLTGCTDEKKHKCTFHHCDKAFDRPSKLARHIRFHTNEKCYNGNNPGCNKACTNSETESTSFELEYRKVIGRTVDEKRHKCTFRDCDKAFDRPSRLARHIRHHTSEKCYKCNHLGCDKAYTNSSHLKRHMETHNPVKKIYRCPECLLLLSNQHNLKRHYNLVHKDPDKLTCKECNLTFTKKYELAKHMSVHAEELSYECDHCKRKYTTFRKLKRHIINFERVTKTYPCTVSGCNEVFNKWHQFCAHQRTQHITYHKCKDCDKVFSKIYLLKAHSKIHAEDRVIFPCTYSDCYRIFYFKNNLVTHIRNNHQGRKFQCDICKVEISAKAKLAEHIQKLHTSRKLVRRTKEEECRKQKNIETRKRNAVSALGDVNLPLAVEHIVLKREIDIPYLEEFESTVPDDNSDL